MPSCGLAGIGAAADVPGIVPGGPRHPREYTALLRSLAEQRSWGAALDAWARMQRDGVEGNLVTYSACLVALERGRCWGAVLAGLLGVRRELDADPDAMAYGPALRATGLGQHWAHAIAAVQHMWAARVEPGTVACGLLLTACAQGRQFGQALAVLEDMLKGKVEPDIFVHSSAIAVAERCSQWRNAGYLLERVRCGAIDANVVAYTAVVGQEWARSMLVLAEMNRRSVEANQVARAAATTALGRGSLWRSASSVLLRTLAAAVEPNTVSHHAAMCSETGEQWHLAEGLLLRMSQRGPAPDSKTRTVAATARAAGRQWQRAVASLETSSAGKSRGQDLVAYNSAMSAAALGGAWELALSFCSEVARCSLEPDLITHSAAVAASEGSRQWTSAASLLAAMRVEDLEPGVIAHNAASNAFQKALCWPEALLGLRRLGERGVGADAVGFAVATSALDGSPQWLHVSQLLRCMAVRRLPRDAVAANSALLVLAGARRWQPAMAVLQEMAAEDLEPEATCSSKLIMEYEERGLGSQQASLLPGRLSRWAPDLRPC